MSGQPDSTRRLWGVIPASLPLRRWPHIEQTKPRRKSGLLFLGENYPMYNKYPEVPICQHWDGLIMLCYIIHNTTTDKKYIGITRCTLERRWAKHRKNAREGRPGHLYNAIRRYGSDAFLVALLSHARSWEELCQLERHFIALHRTSEREYGYNLTAGGEGVVATEEVRKKIRLSKLGKSPSTEVRFQISQTLKGRRVGINAKPRPSLWQSRRNEQRNQDKIERRKLRERGLVKWGGHRKKPFSSPNIQSI